MNSTAKKEKTQELIPVEARVSVKFMVNKEGFLQNREETVQQALSEGRAFFSQCDDYFPGPWNEDELGVEEDFDFLMPGGALTLPHHVYAHIDKRLVEMQEEIQTADPTEREVLKRLIQEFEGLQSLYKKRFPCYS